MMKLIGIILLIVVWQVFWGLMTHDWKGDKEFEELGLNPRGGCGEQFDKDGKRWYVEGWS